MITKINIENTASFKQEAALERPFKFQVQLFTPKKEQDAVGIIYSFLGLVKRSTNEPIQTSYSRAKIPYLSMFKTGNDAVIHC